MEAIPRFSRGECPAHGLIEFKTRAERPLGPDSRRFPANTE